MWLIGVRVGKIFPQDVDGNKPAVERVILE